MAEVINPATTPSLSLSNDQTQESANQENSDPSTSAPAATDNGDVTVFHDPNNFNVKHPLQNMWTLWFTKPSSSKDNNWNELLKEVVTFDSVEEFWGVYKGVRPEWEDTQNKHGGKWSYSFKDKKGIDIDELWLHAQLAAIGETLEGENDNEVMGVVLNVRKAFFRIGLWTRSLGKNKGGDGAGKDALMEIGRRFKETLKLAPNELLEFSGHTESAHSGSSRAKAKFTV